MVAFLSPTSPSPSLSFQVFLQTSLARHYWQCHRYQEAWQSFELVLSKADQRQSSSAQHPLFKEYIHALKVREDGEVMGSGGRESDREWENDRRPQHFIACTGSLFWCYHIRSTEVYLGIFRLFHFSISLAPVPSRPASLVPGLPQPQSS